MLKSDKAINAVRFFNGTPVHRLPPPEPFFGTGVYAIYYTGPSAIYAKYRELNRISYSYPIYVGKAVPKGWRQSRAGDIDSQSTELWSRISEHSRSIDVVKSLELSDFSCRFMICEHVASEMISTVEAALIKWHRPIWNTRLDGFGNHDPGSGRYGQARSDWDVVHPGRGFADRCKGVPTPAQLILAAIELELSVLGTGREADDRLAVPDSEVQIRPAKSE